MSLRYAILGYLSTAPGTGYALARQFDTGLGWFWMTKWTPLSKRPLLSSEEFLLPVCPAGAKRRKQKKGR